MKKKQSHTYERTKKLRYCPLMKIVAYFQVQNEQRREFN